MSLILVYNVILNDLFVLENLNLCKISDPWGRDQCWFFGHYLNNLDRGLLEDDAHNIYPTRRCLSLSYICLCNIKLCPPSLQKDAIHQNILHLDLVILCDCTEWTTFVWLYVKFFLSTSAMWFQRCFVMEMWTDNKQWMLSGHNHSPWPYAQVS